MATIERTDPAVASPGTLIASDGKAVAFAHQILARAYAENEESGEDFESLMIPEHGQGAPDPTRNRSFLYRNVTDDTLYLRTSRDPVEYTRVAGAGAGGGASIPGTSPYAWYQRFVLNPTVPDPLTIPMNGHLTLTVLDNNVTDFELLTDRDIIQDWDGGIEVESPMAGTLVVTQRWEVSFDSGANYVQDVPYHFRIQNGRPLVVDLDLFSTRQVFAAGTFTIGGQEVTITEQDLVRQRTSTAKILLSMENSSNGNSIGVDLTSMNFQNGGLTLFQLNVLTQPVEDSGQLPYLRDVYRFYTRTGLTVPATINAATAVSDTGRGMVFELLPPTVIQGPIYAGIDFVTQWFGGLELEFDTNGEMEATLLTKHEFGENFSKEFTHTRKVPRPVDTNKELHLDLSNFSTISNVMTGTYSPPSGPDVEITPEDLLLPSRITYTLELVLLATRGGARKAANLTYAEFLNPITRSYQIDHAVGSPPVPATPRPGIRTFEITAGDLNPDAGSIGGDTYSYTLAASQPGHVMSARIMGFKGTSASNRVTPASAVRLTTIDADDYALAVGSVEIPADTALEAGETYTLRSEVREDGVTFSELPTAYSDIPIRAREATMSDTTIFFRVPWRVGAAQERPNADTLQDNWTVIVSRERVSGDYTVSGIPDDGERWLLGWAVDSSGAQPSEYSSGGFDISSTVAQPFLITYQGNSFNVYLFKDSGAADHTYNNAVITVGIDN